jgi:cell division protein FtsB
MTPLLRNLIILAALVTGVIYAYSQLTGSKGIGAIRASHAEVERMERENERVKREVERHRKFIDEISKDPELRKQIIRQRLEVHEPGKTTIYDHDGKPQSPAAPLP